MGEIRRPGVIEEPQHSLPGLRREQHRATFAIDRHLRVAYDLRQLDGPAVISNLHFGIGHEITLGFKVVGEADAAVFAGYRRIPGSIVSGMNRPFSTRSAKCGPRCRNRSSWPDAITIAKIVSRNSFSVCSFLPLRGRIMKKRRSREPIALTERAGSSRALHSAKTIG
jgi:hypothetical protein